MSRSGVGGLDHGVEFGGAVGALLRLSTINLWWLVMSSSDAGYGGAQMVSLSHKA
jgi:hypothetical protein